MERKNRTTNLTNCETTPDPKNNGPETDKTKAMSGQTDAEKKHVRIEASRNANPKQKKKVRKKKRKHASLISFLVKLAVIGGVVAFLLLFIVQIRIVHSNDMYPSIRDGQLILVSKVSELMDDVVVLYKTEDGVEHLGRIMGMPDSEIDITEDAGISVNGNVIYQTVPYKTPRGKLRYPYHVPSDSCFILNDYREQETDSRTYGAIPKDSIIGVVFFTLQYRGF